MNNDMFFSVGDCDDLVPTKEEKKLEIREIGDFELRFYFNPELYDASRINLGPLMVNLSLQTGISGPDLSRIHYGEIVLRLNPLIAGKNDKEIVKNNFIKYFDSLKQVTMVTP